MTNLKSYILAFATSLMLVLSTGFANSATVITPLTDGDTNDLLSADVFLFEANPADGPFSASFDFFIDESDAPQNSAAIELTLIGFGSVTDPLLTFSETGNPGNVFSEFSIIGDINSGSIDETIFSVFSLATSLTQTLTLSFANITAPVQVSLQVAAVPLPPAVLLLGTAFAGLGFAARRRRKVA